jgi:hypothetical protein
LSAERPPAAAEPIIGTPSNALARSTCRAALVVVMLIAWVAVRLSGQSATVSAVGANLHVRAPGFGFIKGEPLVRLKDGRSVRVDLELAVLAKPSAGAAAQSRQTFVLSYDLWEERFAVTRIGAPPSSVSHLTSKDAEAWCLAHVPLSVSALGGLGRDAPFWIRLQYQIVAPNPMSSAEEEPLTLRGLIDLLSRRRQAADQEDSIEAGPFRLSDSSRAPSSQ